MRTFWISLGALALIIVLGLLFWTRVTVISYLVLAIALAAYMGLQYEDPDDPVWRQALSAFGYGLQWPRTLAIVIARLFSED